jgi:hypothetical protein
MAINQCMVCCDNFSGQTKKKITCPLGDCNFDVCKECIRTYLLGTSQDPHCMNCRGGWSHEFMVNNLNKCFVNGDYKKHRKTILLDAEKARLPETMPLAEMHREADELEKKKIKEQKQLEIFIDAVKHTRENIRRHELHIYNLRRGRRPQNRNGPADAESNEEKTGAGFIMGCTNETCRGFLSTAYKCGLCETHTCPKCLENTGATAANKTPTHTCNPENIASAQEIKKTTKACPSCATRVFKIEGCDQMWCTQCKTTFSWVTGLLEKGSIHNPHYYQWLRTQNAENMLREPGDVVCGGVPGYNLINRTTFHWLKLINKRFPQNAEVQNAEVPPAIALKINNVDSPHKISKTTTDILRNYVENIHRTARHVTQITLAVTRQQIRTLADHQKERIDYLLEKTTEEQFRDAIYKKDLRRARLTESVHLDELFSTMSIEFLNGLVQMGERHTNEVKFINEIKTRCREFMRFTNFYNLEMQKIGARHNIRFDQITSSGTIRGMRINKKEIEQRKELNIAEERVALFNHV